MAIEPVEQGAETFRDYSTETIASTEASAIEASPFVEAPAANGNIEVGYPTETFAPVDTISNLLSSHQVSDRVAGVEELARLSGDEVFERICGTFDDPAAEVRNAAAMALYGHSADHAGTFTRALREATPERRRNIGQAIAGSGLATDAIGHLSGESREKTYDAFSLLFLMAKAGEVHPLVRAVESHPNTEVRLAVVKLLALSGQNDILPAFRRLAVRG